MEITNELANAILQYLATRPYAEVFRLIAALQSGTPLPEPEKEEEDTDSHKAE